MTVSANRDDQATRRTVLLCAGLAGAGVAITGCSTAAVPYDANDAGVAPGEEPTTASAAAAGSGNGAAAMGGGKAVGGQQGTLLGSTAEIPVGGGVVFAAARVVVTQPAKGVFKAFSAVCTHVGCLCNQVANGTIDCPCHGSKFKISNGAVVTGPASTPLPSRKITVTDGKVFLE